MLDTEYNETEVMELFKAFYPAVTIFIAGYFMASTI